ncbi:MAG: hypothetical protein WCO69_03365 [Candidatus Omnitrophota bacterium]
MNNKGSLAITVMVIFVLSALSAAFLMRGVAERWNTGRVVKSSAALWAAEAGVQKAMWENVYNNCAGMTRTAGNTLCNGNKTMAGTLAGYGDYDVTLDSTNAIIQSVGSVPSRTDPKKVTRRVQANLAKPAIFAFGMFAQGKVTVSNNALVDAFNSSTGIYGGTNIDHSHGSVGSNGTSAGIVEVDNNANVWGDVSTGPGGSVTNSGNIHGQITNANSVALPAVVVPATLTGLASQGALTLGQKGTRTLTAGDYKYSNISLGNKAVLTISGNVRLYLTGDASKNALVSGNASETTISVASGGSLTIYTDGVVNLNNNNVINTLSQKPKDFLIYSTYTGANGVAVSNNATSYMAIYAPQTDVSASNNAGLYGAVVGKTASLNNNGDIHFDMALAGLANPFESVIVTNWREY